MTDHSILPPAETDFLLELRKKIRREKLARREKANLPFGSTRQSVKAERNLFYLADKGVIPARPQSIRVANELVDDNQRRQEREQNLVDDATTKRLIHQQANERAALSSL